MIQYYLMIENANLHTNLLVVWTGENDTKTISVEASLSENGAKQLRFRLKTD